MEERVRKEILFKLFFRVLVCFPLLKIAGCLLLKETSTAVPIKICSISLVPCQQYQLCPQGFSFLSESMFMFSHSPRHKDGLHLLCLRFHYRDHILLCCILSMVL